jgi:Cation transporter/ATPase, N-terminus
VFGPNLLPRTARRTWWAGLVGQIGRPLALLLWAAAGFALVAGTPVLCWASGCYRSERGGGVPAGAQAEGILDREQKITWPRQLYSGARERHLNAPRIDSRRVSRTPSDASV